MSFRKEKKYILNPANTIHFYKWIEDNGCKQIYENRKINSIYFDNLKFQMYHDSNEGVLPRKKIRLRFYNNEKNKIFLEKKISSPEGRFKQSKLIQNEESIFEKAIFDKVYGICRPILKVTYEREYYKYNNYRITFDKGLIYSKFQSKKEFGDNYSVIEFKGNFIDEDNLNVTFPYLDSRFSKYCRACDLIKEFRL